MTNPRYPAPRFFEGAVDVSDSLSPVVLDYEAALRSIVKSAAEPGFTPQAWDALGEFIAVAEFERVGTWMEVMNWEQYTGFLTKWASASAGFETVIRRVSELPGLVYLEVEERHTRPAGNVDVVNSLSVYEFTDAGKIRHLDVYLQQLR
jgi:hypothetical protein